MVEAWYQNGMGRGRRMKERQKASGIGFLSSFMEAPDAGWQVSPAGGQRRFVRADAPDCVASGYWKALSPADRRVVCIKTIRADVTLGFLHVSLFWCF